MVLGLASGPARADGVLEVRGAYYKERATRVVQPMLDAAFDAGDHGLVVGHLLVDSITSASASTGALAGEFTEKRYEGALGYTHELPGRVKLGGDVRHSTESDYDSTWLGAHVEVALAGQATRLRLAAGHSFDEITNGVAVSQGALGTPRREEALGVTVVSLGATQILTPVLVSALTWDLGYLDGYQANLYRVVRGGTEPVAERVPRVRVRNAFAAELRGRLSATGTTCVAAYRLYLDDWGIVAHTPEVRLVQEVAKGIDLRVRYRLHAQGAAEFFRTVYTQDEVSDPRTSVTADDKLGAFQTQTLGGQVSVTMANLGFPGSFGDARLDLVVERVWQTSAFGDAWVGQLGFTLPFVY